jgi:hypothetical protein
MCTTSGRVSEKWPIHSDLLGSRLHSYRTNADAGDVGPHGRLGHQGALESTRESLQTERQLHHDRRNVAGCGGKELIRTALFALHSEQREFAAKACENFGLWGLAFFRRPNPPRRPVSAHWGTQRHPLYFPVSKHLNAGLITHGGAPPQIACPRSVRKQNDRWIEQVDRAELSELDAGGARLDKALTGPFSVRRCRQVLGELTADRNLSRQIAIGDIDVDLTIDRPSGRPFGAVEGCSVAFEGQHPGK